MVPEVGTIDPTVLAFETDRSNYLEEQVIMTADLTGTVALITGATSGIGRATALRLAAAGAHVLAGGRDPARGEAVVAAVRAGGGKADFLPADLSDASSARALARGAIEAGGGRVDILVNNAGIFPAGPTPDMTETDIDAVFAVNVKVPFVLVGELAPAMAARGKGAIINVGTMAAEFGIAGMALYGASKAALNLLTKAWAAEFGRAGVRVNAVNPGPTDTEGTAVLRAAQDQMAALAPAGRVASPEEIAAAIAYLASDDASFMHGAILAVDGGRTAA
jgi:NAD(P)-dependent dehydrogenase (short-subunit alcohol dehydrogenase family)